MTPFFAIIFTCGILSCEQPKPMDFETEVACRGFAENFIDSSPNGLAVACFKRASGEMFYSSREEYKKRKTAK